MVIIKTLSNNRGVALIVLIVAMTLIAILGTSFVSLMGSNKKVFCIRLTHTVPSTLPMQELNMQ